MTEHGYTHPTTIGPTWGPVKGQTSFWISSLGLPRHCQNCIIVGVSLCLLIIVLPPDSAHSEVSGLLCGLKAFRTLFCIFPLFLSLAKRLGSPLYCSSIYFPEWIQHPNTDCSRSQFLNRCSLFPR